MSNSKQQTVLKSFNITDDSLVNQLIKPPKKQLTKTSWNTTNVRPHQYHQADLLYLPNDDGYKYCLVVVDISTKELQARPLKKRDGKTTLKAFKSIYNGDENSLSLPSILHIDGGSEFSSTLKKWIKSQGVAIRVSSPDRHSQQSIVEAQNRIIGGIILILQLNDELVYNTDILKWVENLPKIITILNENKQESQYIPIQGDEGVLCNGNDCNILSIGEKVRVALDRPVDINGKKIGNSFRSADIRWSRKPHTIENVLMFPNQPIRYVVSGIKRNSFSKNQLRIYKEGNSIPISEQYEIEKLVKRFKKNRKVYFKVKWKDYDDLTDEPRSQLMKDVPDLVRTFEN